MNYLIINGSPRHGHTWQIVENVKNNLSNADNNASFDEIDLKDINLPTCIGCYNCFTHGENSCPHSSIIQPIVEMMKDCDGLIITSPVYALNVTGLIKNFIDHLAYFYHRPCFFNKKALIIVTTAGIGQKKVSKYLEETLRNWGYNERFELYLIGRYAKEGELPAKIDDKIKKISTEFYKSTASGNLKSPNLHALYMYSVWRAMASARLVELDYNYWKDNNMLDNEYFPSVSCNYFKRLPFKVLYYILKRVFSKD